MSISNHLNLVVCLLLTALLTACGGGGDGNPSQPELQAQPSQVATEGSFVVEGGNSAIALGAHAVNTQYEGAAGALEVDGVVLEEVIPASTDFNARIVFSQTDPKKFAVSLVDNKVSPALVYACRSGDAWTATEVTTVAAPYHVADLPVCPTPITIDAGMHKATISSLKLVALSDTSKTITASAKLSWDAPASLAVLDGSSDMTPGTYYVIGRASSSASLGTGWTGTIEVGTATIDTTPLTVTLQYPDSAPGKIYLTVLSKADKAVYRCMSSAWTDAEQLQIHPQVNAGLDINEVPFVTVPVCPSSMRFDGSSRRLSMTKTVLQAYGDASKSLMLDVDLVMPAPAFPVAAGVSESGHTPM